MKGVNRNARRTRSVRARGRDRCHGRPHQFRADPYAGLRRRNAPSPTRPAPKRTRVVGSGTGI